MKSSFLATAAVFVLMQGVQAGTITETQSVAFDLSGEDRAFDFAGLPLSDGTGGTLTVETFQGGSFPGLDLEGANEFFEVVGEGTSFGAFNCTGVGGNTRISGAFLESQFGFIDCQFSIKLEFSGLFLVGLLSVGLASLDINFSNAVTAFTSDNDGINVTLSYEEGDVDLAPVPLPATGLMLIAGLGGLVAMRRKPCNQA